MTRLIALLFVGVTIAAIPGYRAEIAEWRKGREARLKGEGGWLSLAGLFWLHEGANRFGKDQGNDIVLPDGPAHAGTFTLHGGKVNLTVDGKTRTVAPESDDAAQVGRLKLYVIKRGDKMGIRLKDPESESRRNFHGIESFPVSEAYRVTAKWVAEPRKIPILNIIGQTEQSENPGYAIFRLGGKELRLYQII